MPEDRPGSNQPAPGQGQPPQGQPPADADSLPPPDEPAPEGLSPADEKRLSEEMLEALDAEPGGTGSFLGGFSPPGRIYLEGGVPSTAGPDLSEEQKRQAFEDAFAPDRAVRVREAGTSGAEPPPLSGRPVRLHLMRWADDPFKDFGKKAVIIVAVTVAAVAAVGSVLLFTGGGGNDTQLFIEPVVIDIPSTNAGADQPPAPPAPPVVAAVNRFDFASILSGGPSSVLPGGLQLVTIGSTAHTVPSVAVPNKKPDVAATDLVGRATGVTELSQQSVDLMFNSSVFPCGQGVVAFTVCPEQPLPVPAGRFIVGVEALGGPVPLADPQGSYQFSMAFDSDGDAANNFRAVAPLTKNWLHGVDQSYLLNYAPGQAWNIRVSNYTTGQPQRLPSGARAVIIDNVILYFIPAGELKSASPQYRLSAFWHTGDSGLQGGPWSGSLYPDIDSPLLPLGSSVEAAAPGTNLTILAALAAYVNALRNADGSYIFGHLHPSAPAFYGEAVCRDFFSRLGPDPTFAVRVKKVNGPASWTWQVYNQTVGTIADAYTLSVSITQRGQTVDADVHYGWDAARGQLQIFSACIRPPGS